MTSAADLGPIGAAAAALVSWLSDVAGPVVERPPSDAEDPDAVLAMWPLELLPDQQGYGGAADRPLRLRVRHLVTGHGPQAQATRLLDRALLAATGSTDGATPTLAFEPVAPETWLALGVRPRPALLFDMPAQVIRPQLVGPRVRSPLTLQAGALRALSGRVLGPDDLPLPGIRLEVSGTGASTYSGPGGRFTFAAAPSGIPLQLLLSGRGERRLAEVPAESADDIVVRFDLREG